MMNELLLISTKEYCVGSKSDGDYVQVPNCPLIKYVPPPLTAFPSKLPCDSLV